MKETKYICDWCKDEIFGEVTDIKIGKQHFHMCGSCCWQMLQPILTQLPEYSEKGSRGEGEE